MTQSIIDPGDTCPAGGVRIDSGIDDNLNSVLDPSEVDASEVICHGVVGADGSDGAPGSDGLSSLINVTAEPAGINCRFGGNRVDVGIDLNQNGVLDTDPHEIEHTEYLCSQISEQFDGLVFTEDVAEENMYELYAAWPSAGSVIKLDGPRFYGDFVDSVVLSPDKTHVAYTVVSPATLFVRNLLQPYTPPVQLSLNLTDNERIGWFAWSPDSQRIAFTIGDSLNDGKNTLFTAFRDGTGIAQLTSAIAIPGANILNIAWSPDSQYLAYVYDEQIDGAYQLFTSRPNGHDRSLISAPGQTVYHIIQWAPDGTRVAYLSADRRNLFTAAPATGTYVNISGTPLGATTIVNFSWSPDSRYIAFRGDFDVENTNDLYITLPDQATRQRVSSHLVIDTNVASNVFEFGWSASGQYLAYIADQEIDNKTDVYVAPPGGANTKVSSASDLNVITFAWPPSGTRLAYSRGAELNFVNADGTDHNNVDTVDRLISQLRWSPNGNYLAYIAEDKRYLSNYFGIVKVIDNNGNNAINVSPVVTNGFFWEPYSEIEWSPDGQRLAFEIAYPHELLTSAAAFTELYTVFPDGTGLQKLSLRDTPADFTGTPELGVRVFAYQGNSKLNQ